MVIMFSNGSLVVKCIRGTENERLCSNQQSCI